MAGWGKILWFVEKKREYKGKDVEKRGSRGIFHFTWGEKYNFGKGGWEIKISFSPQIFYLSELPLLKMYLHDNNDDEDDGDDDDNRIDGRDYDNGINYRDDDWDDYDWDDKDDFFFFIFI